MGLLFLWRGLPLCFCAGHHRQVESMVARGSGVHSGLALAEGHHWQLQGIYPVLLHLFCCCFFLFCLDLEYQTPKELYQDSLASSVWQLSRPLSAKKAGEYMQCSRAFVQWMRGTDNSGPGAFDQSSYDNLSALIDCGVWPQ